MIFPMMMICTIHFCQRMRELHWKKPVHRINLKKEQTGILHPRVQDGEHRELRIQCLTSMPSTNDQVKLSSSKITPDNDGYEDFLTIKINLTGNGNVVSVRVFDETGNYVRNIASNLFAGNEASLIWDGTADDGSMVETGIYIILITLYNDTGKTASWKKVCTVIRNSYLLLFSLCRSVSSL